MVAALRHHYLEVEKVVPKLLAYLAGTDES
jgi:hypothetical protein